MQTVNYQKINEMQKLQIQHKDGYDVFSEQDRQNQIGQSPKKQLKVETYKSFWTVFSIILNISLSPFYFGYIIAYFSSIDFATISQAYHIQFSKDIAQGILVSCLPIGGGIGAYASGFLLEKYSRRHSLLLVNALAFIAGILLFIPQIQFLLFARILQGMCAGFYSSIVPLLMKEISPNELSGTMTTCNQIFIGSGIFFAFVFSKILQQIYEDVSGRSTWRIQFGFPFIILTVQTLFLMFKFNFQTPKYLLLKNRDNQAKKLFQLIYKQQYVSKVIRQMKADLGKTVNTEQVGKDHNKREQMEISLFTSRSAFIMAFHLSALQQFCGINAIMAYGGEIVAESSPSMRLTLPILLNLEQVIASIFTSFLLTKIGRKKLLQLGALGAAFTCFVVGIGFLVRQSSPKAALALILFGLVLFMANFGMTLGPVVWVYLPEIVQPKVLSYAATINWLTAAFIMLIFPVLKQKLPNKNPALLFLFFATWCILSYFINRNYLIETKDKGEKEIFLQFSGKESLF